MCKFRGVLLTYCDLLYLSILSSLLLTNGVSFSTFTIGVSSSICKQFWIQMNNVVPAIFWVCLLQAGLQIALAMVHTSNMQAVCIKTVVNRMVGHPGKLPWVLHVVLPIGDWRSFSHNAAGGRVTLFCGFRIFRDLRSPEPVLPSKSPFRGARKWSEENHGENGNGLPHLPWKLPAKASRFWRKQTEAGNQSWKMNPTWKGLENSSVFHGNLRVTPPMPRLPPRNSRPY